jgi:hypothetical protein
MQHITVMQHKSFNDICIFLDLFARKSRKGLLAAIVIFVLFGLYFVKPLI